MFVHYNSLLCWVRERGQHATKREGGHHIRIVRVFRDMQFHISAQTEDRGEMLRMRHGMRNYRCPLHK